jgi:hypothetical protein
MTKVNPMTKPLFFIKVFLIFEQMKIAIPWKRYPNEKN